MRRSLIPFAAKSLSAVHRSIYALSGGRIGARIWTLPIVLLTTTGRTSGKPRTVALCALPDGRDFIVIASFGGLDRSPAWWLNLERTPAATLQVGTERLAVTARATAGDERERLWARVVERAPGYLSYARRTTREIPVVVLARSPGVAP